MAIPHHLSKKAIEDFKRIYKKEFSEETTDDQAQEMGMNLLRLIEATNSLKQEKKQELSEDQASSFK